jgi:NAD-dependent SIR2 family protein deacetylase
VRTALFTGAGASCAIGYPLTKDLLPRVREQLRDRTLFKGTSDKPTETRSRRELHEFLTSLLPGLEEAESADLPLITEIFSLVEHAISADEDLPLGNDGVLRRFRDLLKLAITDVILGDFTEPWDESNPEHEKQRETLDRLVAWVRRRGRDIGLITTNYDIGLEYELYDRIGLSNLATKIDLGFDWRDTSDGRQRTRPADPALRVFKLHGSLDQLRCKLCGHVYFNEWGAIAVQTFRPKLDENNTCHCRDRARLDLHIVAPSLVRGTPEGNLQGVWRNAFEWMRNAERWVIVGYSLPPEDLAVRSFLLRAFATAPRKPQIIVVQKGDSEKARYKLLFPDCAYLTGGLEAFLDAEGERAGAATPRRVTRRDRTRQKHRK